MKRSVILLGIAIALGGFIGCNDPVVTEVEVIGSPAVGQNFYLAIKVDPDTPAEDLYGQCFDILYNTADITFNTTVQINQGGGFAFDYETHNYRNGQTDRLVVCVSKEGQVSGSDGTGEIVRLRFTGVSTGWTTISFDDQYLVHSTGNNGPIDMPDKSINIL